MKKIVIAAFIVGVIVGLISGFFGSRYYFTIKGKIRSILYNSKMSSNTTTTSSISGYKLSDANELILSCFEGKTDVDRWSGDRLKTSLSKENYSEGDFSLKVVFPKGDFPGLGAWRTLYSDWSAFNILKFDIYNPQSDSVKFGILIKDEFGDAYPDRFDREFNLQPGMNNLELSIGGIKTNNSQRLMRTNKIKQVVFFLCKPQSETVLYFDNVRLGSPRTSNRPREAISFTIDSENTVARINPLIFGSNLGYNNTDEVKVEEFVQDFGLALIRFPSGVLGYHWKTGTFDFATDKPHMFFFSKYENVVKFCRDTNTQLSIMINLESGTPEEAAEWVEHTNKKLGFYVKYWDLDGEPYGHWSKSFRTAEEYAKNLKEYSQAMKSVDSTIKIGASWAGEVFGDWDSIVLRKAGEYVDFISYHWYPNHTSKRLKVGDKAHPEPLDVVGNAFNVPKIVERMRKIIKRECPSKAGKIEFGFMEWDGAWDAPWYDPEPYEQNVIQWSLANALFYAETFAQYIMEGITLSAQHDFQDTPFGLIRGHLTESTADNVHWDGQTIRPKAYAIKMFRKHFGTSLVESKLKNSPVYFKAPDWYDSSYSGEVPFLSCYASKDEEGKKLYIMFINRHPKENLDINVEVKGFIFKDRSNIWKLTGPEITSQNDGYPGQVDIFHEELSFSGPAFTYSCPAHSVVSLELEKAE